MEHNHEGRQEWCICIPKKKSYFYHKKAAVSNIQLIKEKTIDYNSTRNSGVFETNYGTPLSVQSHGRNFGNINFFKTTKSKSSLSNGKLTDYITAAVSTVCKYKKEWSKTNTDIVSEKKAKLNIVSSPLIKENEFNRDTKSSKEVLPLNLKNLYKKYLTN